MHCSANMWMRHWVNYSEAVEQIKAGKLRDRFRQPSQTRAGIANRRRERLPRLRR